MRTSRVLLMIVAVHAQTLVIVFVLQIAFTFSFSNATIINSTSGVRQKYFLIIIIPNFWA